MENSTPATMSQAARVTWRLLWRRRPTPGAHGSNGKTRWDCACPAQVCADPRGGPTAPPGRDGMRPRVLRQPDAAGYTTVPVTNYREAHHVADACRSQPDHSGRDRESEGAQHQDQRRGV